MANLLANPGNWTDEASNSPPSSWNGTAFAVSHDSATFAGFSMVAAGQPGDTVSGSASFSSDAGSAAFVNLVDVATSTVVASAAIPGTFSLAVSAAGSYRLIVAASAAAHDPTQYYGLNASITPAQVPLTAACEELGRVTRAYVSGYQRDRIHLSRLVRGEKRCLVADFNGAIPPARTIASVIWRTNQNWCVNMENARIDGREATVNITAQAGSQAAVKCEVTLDNGEVYNQLFVIEVRSAPWFQGETNPVSGPQSLTATA